jgi:methionyl-tRNA formyltransferase
MRIIFAGSSQMAVPGLKALLDSRHKLSAVITQPDRPKGRGLKESETPVKTEVLKHNITALQPESVNSPDFIRTLAGFKPELIAVIAYGQKLSTAVLNLPPKGCINMHPSLLPKYRGAAPVNHALLNGDKETSVTIFRLTGRMDAGPIIRQVKYQIGDEQTALELGRELAELGARALVEALDEIESGKAAFTEQDESQATPAPKLAKSDGLIDWSRPAQGIYNRFRALQPWPGVFWMFKGTQIAVTGMKLLINTASAGPAGIIADINNQGILVQTGQGALVVTQVKPAGKRTMPALEFVNGYRIQKGERLGSVSAK